MHYKINLIRDVMVQSQSMQFDSADMWEQPRLMHTITTAKTHLTVPAGSTYKIIIRITETIRTRSNDFDDEDRTDGTCEKCIEKYYGEYR